MHQRNLTSGVHGEFAKRRKSRVEYVRCACFWYNMRIKGDGK